jgi:hypothetical protein
MWKMNQQGNNSTVFPVARVWYAVRLQPQHYRRLPLIHREKDHPYSIMESLDDFVDAVARITRGRRPALTATLSRYFTHDLPSGGAAIDARRFEELIRALPTPLMVEGYVVPYYIHQTLQTKYDPYCVHFDNSSVVMSVGKKRRRGPTGIISEFRGGVVFPVLPVSAQVFGKTSRVTKTQNSTLRLMEPYFRVGLRTNIHYQRGYRKQVSGGSQEDPAAVGRALHLSDRNILSVQDYLAKQESVSHVQSLQRVKEDSCECFRQTATQRDIENSFQQPLLSLLTQRGWYDYLGLSQYTKDLRKRRQNVTCV